MIILGTHEAAIDLLEKRSANYSDRAPSAMAELYVPPSTSLESFRELSKSLQNSQVGLLLVPGRTGLWSVVEAPQACDAPVLQPKRGQELLCGAEAGGVPLRSSAHRHT